MPGVLVTRWNLVEEKETSPAKQTQLGTRKNHHEKIDENKFST